VDPFLDTKPMTAAGHTPAHAREKRRPMNGRNTVLPLEWVVVVAVVSG